jgi:aminocarboxymuconate-semialdehyde decarboxylase
MPRRRTIDMHSHVFCIDIEKRVGPDPRKRAEQAAMDQAQGQPSVAANVEMLSHAVPRLVNMDLRLAELDAMGVDLQLLAPSPNQYYDWAEEPLAERITTLANEQVAELVRQQPQRFVGLGTVALQHPALAVRQLEHAVTTLGLKGVEISTTIAGCGLDDPRFEPFWAKAAELGCVVMIHPMGSEQGERLNRWYLWNVIGQPFETTVALTELIFGGVFDRHPGLKVYSVHGGGYLPAYWGRSDHAWRVRPEARTCRNLPSGYLKRIWFDTVVFDPLELRQLIDSVGLSQVMVGTDGPFDMGHYDMHALVDAVPGLSEADRAALQHGNAERLLGLA